MLQTKVVDIKTVLYSVTFSRKSCLLRDNVQKYCTAGQGTHYTVMLRRRDAIFMSAN